MNYKVIFVAVVALAACAKDPDSIAAVSVGDNQYRGYSCAQLSDIDLKYKQSLQNLSAQQKDAAGGDALGVFLLGLPLSSMSGGDKETQIAVAKGHIQAVERERARKGCR